MALTPEQREQAIRLVVESGEGVHLTLPVNPDVDLSDDAARDAEADRLAGVLDEMVEKFLEHVWEIAQRKAQHADSDDVDPESVPLLFPNGFPSDDED
ncbi:hypothetical protein ACFFRE_05040 [Aciditerrimonas ferrireducens]|uniref:DUF1844 domain-containing protein n=1 Tax=Aciditerrimonas ferrireducens TaxID=667306 RepID=A0ABV6C3F1_9ACTN